MSGVLLDTSQLCRNCIARIESFDEHYTTAMRIKDELCEVIKTANALVLIKIEPDIKEEPEVSFTDFAPNEDPPHLDDDTYVDNSFFNNNPKKDPDFSDELSGDLDIGDEPLTIPVKRKLGRQKKITKGIKYSCVTCGKDFPRLRNLTRHRRIHAKDRKIFVCDLCDNKYKLKMNLRLHLESVHTNIRNFLCSQCPKAFASNSRLRVHATTHIEFKKECCNQCGARFHNKEKLKRHLRGTHSLERNFGCPICGLRFKQGYNVNAHMRTVKSHNSEEAVNDFKINPNFRFT